jgi:sulfonate transport system permease protein
MAWVWDGCSSRRGRARRRTGVSPDRQSTTATGEIVAAILAFAVLGKTTDAIVVLASAPFLRWEDKFRPVSEN